MSEPMLRRMWPGAPARDDVRRWQERLLELGFHPGRADGLFGFRTEAATEAFQAARGLDADGIVGPLTRAAAEVEAPASTPPTGAVPKVATPLTDRGIVEVLSDGHTEALGTLPSHPRLMCGWSMIALENAHGRALWRWNFGNISAFGRWPGPYYVIRVQERIQQNPDKWRWVDMRFRAYPDALSGAADYWRLMAGRYGSALARFDAGDPAGGARELGRLGYFTAHVEQYADTMSRLYRAWPG